MRNNSSKSFNYMTTFYISFFILITVIAYLLFKHEPIVFRRIVALWPIGILILSTILQNLYFDTKAWIFLPLGGFSFIYGIMFTINLHNPYLTEKMISPIFCLALATALLNYYIFKRRNDLILPFILLLILGGILLLLFPIYANYLTLTGSNLSLITIILLITTYIILLAIKK